MADLAWLTTPEGFECDGYMIRRVDGSRWRLEAQDRPGRDGRRLRMSEHDSLRQAKAQARRNDDVRIRRARIIVHLAVGFAATLAFVGFLAVIESLGGYLLALIALFVGLRSFADAVGVLSGDAWGWTRDNGAPEQPSWYDRAILKSVDAVYRRSAAAARAEPAAAVVMLSPVD